MKYSVLLVCLIWITQPIMAMEYNGSLNQATSVFIPIKDKGHGAHAPILINDVIGKDKRITRATNELSDSFCYRNARVICVVSVIVLLGGAITISLVAQ